MMADDGENGAISEAEAALYDRQIRLWGLDAQRRLNAYQNWKNPEVSPNCPNCGALETTRHYLYHCPRYEKERQHMLLEAENLYETYNIAEECRDTDIVTLAGMREDLPETINKQMYLALSRLRASSVLIAGLKGLGAEVAKNIVLSGVKAVTLLDHQQVTEEDFSSQFLVSRADLGRNRAEASLDRTQNLNPNVKVTADTEDVKDKPDEFFTKFSVVCLTCCSQQTLRRVGHVCHDNGVKFYAGNVHGYCGYMFADLGEHDYVEEKPKIIKTDKQKEEGTEDGPAAKKAKVDTTETVMVKKTVSYCPWEESQAVDWTSDSSSKALKKTPQMYFVMKDSSSKALKKTPQMYFVMKDSSSKALKKTPQMYFVMKDSSSKALKKTPQMYFIMKVLLRFREDHDRDPAVSSREEDKVALLRLRDDVLTEMKLKTDLVGDEFASHCFAALSPVCAVVGGVLAQEIVKAVSGKDAPLNNFFFFNGIDDSGMVDCIRSS
ncbi:SAE1 [Branchiostoma lanceolatum]|uniref:SUMO-activating enzyme subunit 1 n=1 Tax=Branchiostoma lanceolatum TaxID=7740 RepID=A0A8J9ZPV2_BRALA|nr:SAE1 [Branchiostoma lanceolatum]